MLELSYLLISGTLLFTFTFYYLLKTYLVEWGCRTFLKNRVRIVEHRDANENGSSTTANGCDKSAKGDSKLTSVTKGDIAEISQL